MAELKQVSFPPEILARIAPDISLQRHLSIGLRPNLRNFTEFKPIDIASNNELTENNNNVFGSSVIKSGSTTVINTITLGVVEVNSSTKSATTEQLGNAGYTTVYPVIEIARGRSGAPTDEEMILSQTLHETLLHSRLIPKASLSINNYGAAVYDATLSNYSIYYPDLNPQEFELINFNHSKSYTFVLLSHIKIFSRQKSTSALFDLCHLSTVHALSRLQLPRVYISDTTSGTKVSVKSRSSNTRGLVGLSRSNINIDTNKELFYPLVLNNSEDAMVDSSGPFDHSGVSSNFGVVTVADADKEGNDEEGKRSILLADLEGEAEESAILSRLSIISNKSNTIKKISLINGDGNSEISLDILKQALEIAKLRAQQM
ncbi:uncharacterized protein RJT20DRAFT_127804 [Scheffersomyces xylosifermentans]|uniref:uncharacterized protein n=1 Tax=Scheffersomyces xylosifermentans TaxID=1304137 RepID=UPI00315D59A1